MPLSFRKLSYLLLCFSMIVLSGCKIQGTIDASQKSIKRGQSTTLTWGLGVFSGKAKQTVIEPDIGAVSAKGSMATLHQRLAAAMKGLKFPCDRIPGIIQSMKTGSTPVLPGLEINSVNTMFCFLISVLTAANALRLAGMAYWKKRVTSCLSPRPIYV